MTVYIIATLRRFGNPSGPGLAYWPIMSLVAGDILAHSYRLLEPIGEGGMGCVWLAEHITLDRKVAVKLMSDEAISDPETRERFDREARATAKVDSPHVVRVLDFDFTGEGLPFLVLELLSGETLEERILRSGPLSLEEAKAVLDQTSEALGVAHSCGILHRDIKAENLFLQRSARPVDLKLLDFGIALVRTPGTHVTLPRGPIGTPQYMSPEQIMVSEVNEQSDLFSLAVCIYYALTGDFPFRGETFATISVACLRGSFEPPSALRRGLPAPLDAWFRQALALEPAKRFATAASMRESFARAIASPPRMSRNTPLALEIDLPAPRARRRVGWLVGCAALVACGAFAATRMSFRSSPAIELVAQASSMTSPAVSVAPAPVLIIDPSPARPVAAVAAASPVSPTHAASPRRRRAPVSVPDASVAVAPASSAFDPNGASEFGSRE